jgi:integrase/recombinase XerD
VAKPVIVPSPVAPPIALLVEDYLASCRARGLAPSTINQAYRYTLDDVFLPWCAENGVTEPAQLTQRVLDCFTSELLEHGGRRGQLSRHTIHHYGRVVRQFLRWAAKEGEPVSGTPQLPKLPRKVLDTLTMEEITRMEDAAPAERDKLIIRLLADTGMRVGELCALRTGDVVRAQDRRAFLKVQGKGSKERLVPLSPPLVRRIHRYMRGRPAGEQLFIALRRGKDGDYAPITRSGVLQLIRHTATRAGVTKRVHPHLFRHTFATEALRAGMNPVQLAQLLGHSGLRMIEQVYSHLNAGDAYDAVMKMLIAES